MKKFPLILLITSLCFAKVWADDAPVSTQKTLPNGDMQSQVVSKDSTVTTVQHKDGSSETTTTNSDGSSSVVKQNADGTVESGDTPAMGSPK